MGQLQNNTKCHADDTDQADDRRFIISIKDLRKSVQSASSVCHLETVTKQH